MGARAMTERAIPWSSMTDQSTPTTTLEFEAPDVAVDSADRVVGEAVSIIDGALARMMQRDLVSSTEVADLLLDLRTLLTSD